MFRSLSKLAANQLKIGGGFKRHAVSSSGNTVLDRNFFQPVAEYDPEFEKKFKMTTLTNGVRVATFNVNLPTTTVGLFVNTGSRYENESTNGTAHFLEHMAFKGTQKLDQRAMEKQIENMGSRLFAYTSREHTAYYGKCFKEDTAKLVGIFSDIIQKPLLKEEAIERERSVILREMEEVESQIDEVIFDYLHGTAYQGTPLGFTILGPSANVKRIGRKELFEYIQTNYTGPRTVLVTVGNVNHDEVVDMAKLNLSALSKDFFNPSSPPATPLKVTPAVYIGSEARIRLDDMPHAHVAYAFEGVPQNHPDFIPLMLASMYIGSYNQAMVVGKSHSSKLARRAANGDLCNSFTSFHASYSDTGLWGIYFVTEKHKIFDFMFGVAREWNYLRDQFTDFDTQVAKNLFKSSYFMQYDAGTTSVFEEIGRQILAYNQYYTPHEIGRMVDAITTEDIREAVDRMLKQSDHVTACMGPVEQMPDYLMCKTLSYNPFL